MKQKSICIILFCVSILIIIGILFFLLPIPKTEEETEYLVMESEAATMQDAQSVETFSDRTTEQTQIGRYVVIDIENRLHIYDDYAHAVVYQSGIRVDQLPDEIKEKVKEGIIFSSEQEMFEFLESYSS